MADGRCWADGINRTKSYRWTLTDIGRKLTDVEQMLTDVGQKLKDVEWKLADVK